MTDTGNVLIYSCLIIYTVNYITGWLLYTGIIRIGRSVHQIMFASLIINLIIILIFSKLPLSEKIICALSLSAMLMLPFGKKGGLYHIALSSAGLVLMLLLIFKKYF